MPSSQELEDLVNKGRIGNLLAERFNGTRGHLNPESQDSSVIISFPTRDAVPPVDQIASVISEFFLEIGYAVVDHGSEPETYFAQVLVPRPEMSGIVINITTHYPYEGHTNNLRMSCEFDKV